MTYGPTLRPEPTGLFRTDLPLCDTNTDAYTVSYKNSPKAVELIDNSGNDNIQFTQCKLNIDTM